jgi:hypothetical protein
MLISAFTFSVGKIPSVVAASLDRLSRGLHPYIRD